MDIPVPGIAAFFPPKKGRHVRKQAKHIKAHRWLPNHSLDLNIGQFVCKVFFAALKSGPNLPTLFNDPFQN